MMIYQDRWLSSRYTGIHEYDDYTLTNKKYVWTNIGRELTNRSIMVMPEVQDETLKNTLNVRCAGICSDWVQKIKVMRA